MCTNVLSFFFLFVFFICFSFSSFLVDSCCCCCRCCVSALVLHHCCTPRLYIFSCVLCWTLLLFGFFLSPPSWIFVYCLCSHPAPHMIHVKSTQESTSLFTLCVCVELWHSSSEHLYRADRTPLNVNYTRANGRVFSYHPVYLWVGQQL